ncbi:MAG: bifunctional riboflavin kinase/FAD synthetase [Bacteroidales bacterium]|nr:bifunctional riboflavin kinase/FAD synthetase [Bacteroidales bacterium]MCL2132772.1 bifunctional riboflavin kinase/FAD synthetase [Bacteroidales bacterium]
MGIVATTGFFDGVHIGHQSVLNKVLSTAEAQGKENAVITFWPHPRTILGQDAEKLRLLNSLEEKKKILTRLGIQHIHIIPFTNELAQLCTSRFFELHLKQELNVDTLIVGYDHRLGINASDNYATMKSIGGALGIAVEQVESVEYSSFFSSGISSFAPKNNAVSSTKIREALKGGDVQTANECLGYRYSLQGVVVVGNKLGRMLGFPTANMQLYEPLKQLPADGVYAVIVSIAEQSYKGLMNIGLRPTVRGTTRTIETHILDFDQDIYGQPIEVQLLAHIREEQRFDSLDALKQQITKDKEDSRNYF